MSVNRLLFVLFTLCAVDVAAVTDAFRIGNVHWAGDCEGTVRTEVSTPGNLGEASSLRFFFEQEFIAESDGQGRVRKLCDGRIETYVPAGMACFVGELSLGATYEKEGDGPVAYVVLWFDYIGQAEAGIIEKAGSGPAGNLLLKKTVEASELQCLPEPATAIFRPTIKLVARAAPGEYANMAIDMTSGSIDFQIVCQPCL